MKQIVAMLMLIGLAAGASAGDMNHALEATARAKDGDSVWAQDAQGRYQRFRLVPLQESAGVPAIGYRADLAEPTRGTFEVDANSVALGVVGAMLFAGGVYAADSCGMFDQGKEFGASFMERLKAFRWPWQKTEPAPATVPAEDPAPDNGGVHLENVNVDGDVMIVTGDDNEQTSTKEGE